MAENAPTEILSRKPENIAVYTNPQHELYLHRARFLPLAMRKGHIGDIVVTRANSLGHESAGIVIAVGAGVTRFKAGDRVALECGIPCMKATCYSCRTGQYNACPEVVFFSTPPHHGTLARYHVHPEDWLHKIPDEMTYEEGSLIEPLSVALAGVERSGVRLGSPVVICGAGPIGLATLLAAQAAGANPIVITDINETRLQFAKKLVPRVRPVTIPTEKTPVEIAEVIKEALGEETQLVLECTGVESSVVAGIYSCRFGGMVFVIGCGKDFQTLPFMHMAGKEIDLRFQYRYHDTYPRAIGLVASGVIDVKPLVTHRFTLE
ncbi:hypothetical protein QQX98_009585 [Neonectria punicea]|uniref:Uncharacterized protein n=1 Tax=Neonectria punicea TaxID=979145 RepID=A0ABR1GRY2_9HYPO